MNKFSPLLASNATVGALALLAIGLATSAPAASPDPALISVDFIAGGTAQPTTPASGDTAASGAVNNAAGLIFTGQVGPWNAFNIDPAGFGNYTYTSVGPSAFLTNAAGAATTVKFAITSRYRCGPGSSSLIGYLRNEYAALYPASSLSADPVTWTLTGLATNGYYRLAMFMGTGVGTNTANGIDGVRDTDGDANWSGVLADDSGTINGSLVGPLTTVLPIYGFQLYALTGTGPLMANAGSPQAINSVMPSVRIGGSPTARGGNPAYTYSWTPATGLNSATVANPTAAPTITTTYTVSVTDSLSAHATSSVIITYLTNINPFALKPFPLSASQRGTVACLESPAISYDVYLPPAYSPYGTPLPIIYTFNPDGGGMVTDFQTICASLNIIAIGVIGSANGVSSDIILKEDYAVARDVRQRVLFDPSAEFAAGFSGGGVSSYMLSRFRSQHVAGVLTFGGWLGRINDGGPHVNYYTIDRVQTNLLVARATGTTDTSTIFYNPFDSNYLATCGAVVQDWSFSGGHGVAPDPVKTDCLSWLLSQRIPAGPNDASNALAQAANWRARNTAGQSGPVLRECVATMMSQPRTWNALEAELVMDELMTNYNGFRPLAVDNLAQGDFASDLFYYAARGAATNQDWQRYYCNLKALTGVTGTSGVTGTTTITGITVTVVIPSTNGSISISGTFGDQAGGIYDMLTNFSYPAPLLQMSAGPTPGQATVWLREDTPGLTYSLQSRSSATIGTWQDMPDSSIETNTLWSAGIYLPPYSGWRFYRLSTAPTLSTSPPWP